MSDNKDLRDGLGQIAVRVKDDPVMLRCCRMIDEALAATHAGAAAEPSVTPEMVEHLKVGVAEVEAIDGNLKALKARLAALTSAPAEPAPVPQDVHGRKAFARYIKDCEKCAIVPDVAGAFHWAWTHIAPPQTPQAAGAIDARGQAITKADVLRAAKNVGLVGWISDCGQWFEFTETQHPSKLLIQFAEHYAALASPQEAPPAAGAAQAVAERYCNKCGYFGPDQWHWRPNGSGECGYLSMPTRAALKAAHRGERKEGE